MNHSTLVLIYEFHALCDTKMKMLVVSQQKYDTYTHFIIVIYESSYLNTRTFRLKRFFVAISLLLPVSVPGVWRNCFLKDLSVFGFIYFYGLYDAICHHNHASYLDCVSYRIALVCKEMK